MDKKDIYELMDKFEKSNMSEIELEMHGVRVAMKKGNQCISTTSTVGMVTNTGVSEIINNNQRNPDLLKRHLLIRNILNDIILKSSVNM